MVQLGLALHVDPGGHMKKGFALAATLTLVASLITAMPSLAEEDPFPGVARGEAVPGYSMAITCSDVPEVPDNCIRRGGGHLFICPSGSANDLTATLREDGSWASVLLWCRKSWVRPSTPEEDRDFQQRIADATKRAEEESKAWNAANPGRQKCVSWGPIVHANGVSEASGGVCANPVSADTAPSGSPSVAADSVVAAPVGEADISSNSSSPTASSSASSSTSVLNPLPLDPTPVGGSDYKGSGFPFTVVVEGQVGRLGCPQGFQAANGLIAYVGLGKTFTECWPERAWAAYRLGGEAWDLYKATGGSYDPTVEIDRRNKVALLKSRAKAVAETAAAQTPGIERCSSWSGFGESGRECAYAFIQPGSASPVVTPPSSSSQTVSPVAQAPASTSSDTSQVAGPSNGDSSTSSSVSVELQTVQVSGSAVVVARQALLITPDPEEAVSISSLAAAISSLKTIQRTMTQALPRDPSLNYRVTSLTPEICKASSFRVRVNSAGVCQLEIEITDSAGNSYEILRKVRRTK